MSGLITHQGRTETLTDYTDCGERPGYDLDMESQRRWAKRHVLANVGHQVHLETTKVRVYRTAPTSTTSDVGGGLSAAEEEGK